MVPLPARNPLQQSCRPCSWAVPVASWGREGPVPSVPAALHGPGVAPHAAPFVLSSLVLPFSWGLLWDSLLFPSSGQVPQSRRCWSQLLCRVCQPCCPWPCRQHTAVLQTCPGSFGPVCEQSWAQLLPGALLSRAVCPALPASPPSSLPGLGSTKLNCIIGRINANWYFSNCNFARVVFFWLSFVPLTAPAWAWGLVLQGGTSLAPSPSCFSCWWRIRAQYPVHAKEPGSKFHGKGQAGTSQLFPVPG